MEITCHYTLSRKQGNLRNIYNVYNINFIQKYVYMHVQLIRYSSKLLSYLEKNMPITVKTKVEIHSL